MHTFKYTFTYDFQLQRSDVDMKECRKVGSNSTHSQSRHWVEASGQGPPKKELSVSIGQEVG
jgi:hypothetical protein